eukprot:CAMPEP_0179012684 /NCGR_PEP_ID=MMETSP0796-20121207/1332_1 /TAXON_ID=73915 /ORGANISM="Pyrodinium bahamense, Strain pbaha01" /LENGTH=86 /DNA_ID=CAMNT_0020708153 /DNA_START=233 /DNA_END=490 /DNA_ORIENTATION=-
MFPFLATSRTLDGLPCPTKATKDIFNCSMVIAGGTFTFTSHPLVPCLMVTSTAASGSCASAALAPPGRTLASPVASAAASPPAAAA